MTGKLTRDQVVAFAAFLAEERARHANDIVVIQYKLAELKSVGIEPAGVAPWIDTESLEEACK